MLAITPTAADAIQALVDRTEAPEGTGLRIAAHAPDNADQDGATQLEVTLATEPAETDEVVDEQGAHVFVAPDVAGFLNDKLLDAQLEGDRVGFTLSDQVA